ncbi:GntR family transcriptional regulator [Streptomyces sp. NPDC056297]|uniref:GntR family transcriptional regulator n=1 Tax=unclassified Streptomyces TaxID=2593676 RepID=UPI0035D7E441
MPGSPTAWKPEDVTPGAVLLIRTCYADTRQCGIVSSPYQRAASILRAEITAGRFKTGQRLPAYRELQERFGIAGMTARSAVAVLRSEGLVRTVQRRGSSSSIRETRPAQARDGPDQQDLIHVEEEPHMDPGAHRGGGTGLLAFERIADDLRDRIRAGKVEPGRLLPSQSELMKTYRASSLTVQKAIRLLRDEGLVTARQGRGTFVLAPGQTREPGTITTLTGLSDAVQKLNDSILGIDQLVRGLARRVSVLESQHSTQSAKQSA